MSLTGMGLEVRTSGGCFLGKKKSSRLRNSDLHSGSSSVVFGRSRLSSGSAPAGGFTSSVGIVNPNSGFSTRVPLFSLMLDEHPGRQVASRQENTCKFAALQLLP